MSDPIVNRVAASTLQTIDLEDYYPPGKRSILDMKKWLHQELILKETEFREALKNYDWSVYKDHFVALTCSADAIIPSWAFLLITTYLSPFAKKVVVGDLKTLENAIFQEIISTMNIETFIGKPVIIKGCAQKPIPESSYVQLIQKLQPVVKSLFFGEACSTVPLFKKTK